MPSDAPMATQPAKTSALDSPGSAKSAWPASGAIMTKCDSNGSKITV
jgi:hypothetical protein